MNFLKVLSTNRKEFSDKIKYRQLAKEIKFYMFEKVLNIFERDLLHQARRNNYTIWSFV